MIMKYILKKTKIKQLSAVKNGSSRIAQARVRLATEREFSALGTPSSIYGRKKKMHKRKQI